LIKVSWNRRPLGWVYNPLESQSPRITLRTPNRRLPATYRKNMEKFPTLKRACISTLKVEKVVKPPQNPTPRSMVVSEDIQLFFIEIPNTRPSNRQPRMLTRKVPRYSWFSLELK
jgi:hypothetical protein